MIDARRVNEFLDLARDRVGGASLQALARAARERSRELRRLLSGPFGEAEVREALTAVFPARRILRRLKAAEGDAGGASGLAPAVARLLRDPGPVAARLDRFCEESGHLLGGAAADVAADLLHASYPEHYWLGARWLWDPAEGTGVIPLLGSAPPTRPGDPPGEVYLSLGEALANLRAVLGPGEAALGPAPFGMDAFVALVYGLYTHLVASVRTTDEFAGILPGPLEMAARLLGARRWLDGVSQGRQEGAAAAADETVSQTGEGGRR